MSIKEFLAARLAAIETATYDPGNAFEVLVKGVENVFLPFDVDGSPLEVGKLVPTEPIDLPFKTFNSSFMLKNGFVSPIKTYRSNVGNVLAALSAADVKSMLNPVETPAESPVEKKGN